MKFGFTLSFVLVLAESFTEEDEGVVTVVGSFPAGLAGCKKEK